jgi:hypothetical protein
VRARVHNDAAREAERIEHRRILIHRPVGRRPVALLCERIALRRPEHVRVGAAGERWNGDWSAIHGRSIKDAPLARVNARASAKSDSLYNESAFPARADGSIIPADKEADGTRTHPRARPDAAFRL